MSPRSSPDQASSSREGNTNSQAHQPHTIVVAGESPIHKISYPRPSRNGTAHNTAYIYGGAQQLEEYLRFSHKGNIYGPSLNNPSPGNDEVACFVDLIAVNPGSDKTSFRVEKHENHELVNAPLFQLPQGCQNDKRSTRVVVFEDSASDIKDGDDITKLWDNELKLFIYKMTGRAGKLAGVLQWGKVRSQSKGVNSNHTIVIIDAEDLRAEGIELSRHLSWEKTAEDFINHLTYNGHFVSLLNCAHLIVIFDCDGVIHYMKDNPKQPKIWFNPEFAEGEYMKDSSRKAANDTAGTYMIGISTAFTAGFASMLASQKLDTPDNINAAVDDGIEEGILCARRLARFGFGMPEKNSPDSDQGIGQPKQSKKRRKKKPNAQQAEHHDKQNGLERQYVPHYPLKIMCRDSEDKRPSSVTIPVAAMNRDSIDQEKNPLGNSRCDTYRPWSFVEHIAGEPAEVAHVIVNDGPTGVLNRVPYASFGSLMTADRKEIEGYRAITNLVNEYAKPRLSSPKPLSIGVFGPPGSGKSFSLTEVVKGVLKTDPETLEFNLSQFTDHSDLTTAFHSVQACTITGKIPLVLFDEFDSSYHNLPLGWLRYFLAPMQDGFFLDHGSKNPLTKAIFVFLGGTSSTFKNFQDKMESPEGISAKLPDFVSRLHGYVDIRGPDPDPPDAKTDKMYPIRRAMLLRAFLARYPHLMDGQKMRIDDSLLHGLLTVAKFRHNARSIQAILSMSRLSGGTRFGLADLPSKDQLNLHVDSEEFMKCVRHRELPDHMSWVKELVAQGLHKCHREALDLKENETENKQLKKYNKAISMEWSELDKVYRDSYIHQADDIPFKLRKIKHYLAEKVAGRDSENGFSQDNATELARLEHERLISERLYKHRALDLDPAQGQVALPPLIPWDDLALEWREVYQKLVQSIPKILKQCGYSVYDLQKSGAQLQS